MNAYLVKHDRGVLRCPGTKARPDVGDDELLIRTSSLPGRSATSERQSSGIDAISIQSRGVQANDFAFSYNRFMRLLTTPLLAGPRHSTIVVEPDDVVVRMGVAGWTFASRVPRASIVDLTRVPGPVMAWGAHGWGGRWLVNGCGVGLVRLTIEPNAQARCLGFPLRLRELTLSLAEPDAFIVAVATPG